MNIDKRVRDAVHQKIREINDETLIRLFMTDEYYIINPYLTSHDLFADKAAELKRLFPKNYEYFKAYHDENSRLPTYTRWYLEEMLFIEYAGIDFSDWAFLDKYFTPVAECYKAEGVSAFMVRKMHGDPNEILDKFKAYPRAGKILVPAVVAAATDNKDKLKSKSACDGLIELVKNAGLEDSLRYLIFDSFLRTHDLATLAYFVNAACEYKLTRFKSLKESMVHADIEYQLQFTSDEYIKVMRSVVDGDYDKFLNGNNGTFRLLTVHTLLKYRKPEFGDIAKKYIQSGNELIRRSFLYVIGMFDRYSQNTGLYYDVVTDYEYTMPEYAAFFHCFAYDGRNGLGPKMFDMILRIYDGMERAKFSVPATDDFPITTNVTKAELANILIGIAKNTGDRKLIAEIEKRYDDLPIDSQGAFLQKLGDVTTLDRRALIVDMLKTDNYYCERAYKESKIKLTYDEAVRVSDFLKSKKQSVKNTILKEFLRSTVKRRICGYLLSCNEQFKREIGEEMQKTLDGKVNDKALEAPRSSYEARQNDSVIALERPNVTFPEYKKRPLEQINPKRIKYLFDEILKFIERNKDYEYQPAYGSTLVTIGSTFKPIEYSFNFKGYPLGEQLEAIFKTLSPVEIVETFLLCKAYIKGPKHYEDSHGKGKALVTFGKLGKKYPMVEAMYVYALLPIALKQFADSDAACEYVKQLCFFGAFSDENNCPYELLTAAMQTDNDENIKALIYLSDKDINPKYRVDIDCTLGSALFAKAYERGLLDGEYIKYRLVKCGTIAHCLTNRDDKNEYYMYSAGYKYPKFRELYKGVIDLCVSSELNRGTLKTPYTSMVGRLAEIYGAEVFVKAIVKARSITLVRNNCEYWFGDQKDDMISKILKTVRPAEDDTAQTFAALVDEYGVTDDELIRAAVYNLNFLNLVSEKLNIPGFKSAVLYFAAHLNESLNESRIEKIKEYSTIDYHDFKDGAFDFDWYADMIHTVPERDFKRIYDNAKYITVAGLHKRAQRFFEALNGKINAEEAKAQILKSRNKDFCLIYSLIPLKDEADLIERYKFFADFLKESKKYGSQRQLTERRTVDIAFDNLARNAGYADSSVFIYEMESRDRRVIDMYDGVEINGYTLKLDCGADKVKLIVTDRSGKKLSAVPSAIAKTEQAIEISEYKKSEEAKRKRLKRSLEEAMENQTPFTAAQILNITAQPLIRSFFERLILTDGMRAYVLTDRKITDIVSGEQATGESFNVAHPVTLKNNGALRAAIKHVITNNIKQPFKQVLREMYLTSDGEKDATEILRYKGYNVDLKKAVAALKGRGWGVSEDIGLRKVYYKCRTIAAIFREFDYYYIYDFGNENRELESIVFIDRNDYVIKKPKDVDPVVFSETMRDVDLMIAISANSTYDYELSMSTFEMRRAVIQSICDILGITNVSFLKENVKVEGALGTYVVNIRTGLVFKEGKGNLLIKTVDNYDKPLALDFIDEDPMTADIVTKVLILSDDGKIKDPAILNEIAG